MWSECFLILSPPHTLVESTGNEIGADTFVQSFDEYFAFHHKKPAEKPQTQSKTFLRFLQNPLVLYLVMLYRTIAFKV